MKICCLFKVIDDYNQPDNDLVVAFDSLPSLDQIAKAVYERSLKELGTQEVVNVVDIWKGKEVSVHSCDYRLEAWNLLKGEGGD